MEKNNKLYHDIYSSPVGLLRIVCTESELKAIELIKSADVLSASNEITAMVKKQLDEYFKGELREFDIPLLIEGTPFQQRVYHALCDISYGTTISYKQLAQSVGNEKACRAVGSANSKNKIMIVVPCHRVIGADGTLTGYAGGLDVKKWLIEHEKNK